MRVHTFLLLLALSLQSQAAPLPALGIDADTISVSGISSGAFMAVQLGVVHSSTFKGVATIAGGLYGCAEGDPKRASEVCMKAPENLDPAQYVQFTNEQFAKDFIENPQNLSRQKVFILNGSEDKTILPVAGEKLAEFYKAFGASVETVFDLKMGHGFPSEKGLNACESSRFPWINRCGYDGAKKILETFYGPLKEPAEKASESLLSFDQSEFYSLTNIKKIMMLTQGHIFIPSICQQAGSKCRLHVALHGCLQNPQVAKTAFTEGAGYNEWAETNKIVILYPAAAAAKGNPNGCWDWFGYTGADYLSKSAPQISAILKMITRLAEPIN